MLSHIDLKKGILFLLEKTPYLVLEHALVFKGRGSSVMQLRVKNLKTGNVLSKTFHAGESFEEAEVEKSHVQFIFENRGQYTFCEVNNPAKRFSLSAEQVRDQAKFLVSNTILEALTFQGEVLTISLPVKMILKVADAPPGVKGDRAQGGTKAVVLETGAEIQVPLFVETGDLVEINTETGEYVRRVQE